MAFKINVMAPLCRIIVYISKKNFKLIVFMDFFNARFYERRIYFLTRLALTFVDNYSI
jgi:hypothetical protein